MGLHNLYFNLIEVLEKYLVNMINLNKLFPNNIFRHSLSRKIFALILKVRLNIILYIFIII